jgi:hypothetical protein
MHTCITLTGGCNLAHHMNILRVKSSFYMGRELESVSALLRASLAAVSFCFLFNVRCCFCSKKLKVMREKAEKVLRLNVGF